MLDPLRAFEKQRVDDLVVLEEAEVFLDGDGDTRGVVLGGWGLGDPSDRLPLRRIDRLEDDSPVLVVAGRQAGDEARMLPDLRQVGLGRVEPLLCLLVEPAALLQCLAQSAQFRVQFSATLFLWPREE